MESKFDNCTSKSIEAFKKNMHNSMLKMYKKDGFLAPVIFYMSGDAIFLELIPPDLLSTREGKETIAYAIKTLCKNKDVLCVGIIMEAWAKKFDPADSAILPWITENLVRIRDFESKDEIIVMIFGTPEKEEMIAYLVDPKTKSVIEEYARGYDPKEADSLFTNFFEFRKPQIIKGKNDN